MAFVAAFSRAECTVREDWFHRDAHVGSLNWVFPLPFQDLHHHIDSDAFCVLLNRSADVTSLLQCQ